MTLQLSYDGESWGLRIEYDTAKFMKSEVGIRIFKEEPSQIGFTTMLHQLYGITEFKQIADEMLWKSQYLDRITFEDEASREKYLSELVRLGQPVPEKSFKEKIRVASGNPETEEVEQEPPDEIELAFSESFKENVIGRDDFQGLSDKKKVQIRGIMLRLIRENAARTGKVNISYDAMDYYYNKAIVEINQDIDEEHAKQG